jgi:hypothetical protein
MQLQISPWKFLELTVLRIAKTVEILRWAGIRAIPEKLSAQVVVLATTIGHLLAGPRRHADEEIDGSDLPFLSDDDERSVGGLLWMCLKKCFASDHTTCFLGAIVKDWEVGMTPMFTSQPCKFDLYYKKKPCKHLIWTGNDNGRSILIESY